MITIGSESAPTSSFAIRRQICAVIVTFNPEKILEQNIRALRPEVDHIIVVDNHSTADRQSMIAELASSTGVEVIWNRENIGIAAALNSGIRHALSQKPYGWLATFDQDSRILPGFMAAMIAAWESCPFREEVAVIGPSYIHEVVNPRTRESKGMSDRLYEERLTTMTSGNLVSPTAFQASGMFDESFFIDYVDHEFCLRLRSRGFRVIEATRARLIHRLGSRTLHRIFARTAVTSNYSPFRRYYNTRNRLRVYGRYLVAEPLWVASDMYGWSKEILKLLLFEQNRRTKISSMLRGAWHAIRGVSRSEPTQPENFEKCLNLHSSNEP